MGFLACEWVRVLSSSLIMQALTISELERASGVPRSTIYFYVREGMLPEAQKAAASRAIYTDRHLALLQEIVRLKAEGLPLTAIKERMAAQIASAGATDVDLVAEQNEHVRHSILVVAARLFARRGYKRTRVTDIIKEAEVTPQVFYGHFASKLDLFMESYGLFVEWMHSFLAGGLVDEPDPAARELARTHGYLGMRNLSPDLLCLVRSEALQEECDMQKVVEKSYGGVTRATLEDLLRLREQGQTALPVPDELVAFGLLGAVENMVMRVSWDDRYSTKDVLWTALFLFLAVEGAYSGRTDLTDRLTRYTEAVERLAAQPPPTPPAAYLS